MAVTEREIDPKVSAEVEHAADGSYALRPLTAIIIRLGRHKTIYFFALCSYRISHTRTASLLINQSFFFKLF